ncbi:carbohydrate-binding module family 50 protein [Sporormia fimetaria CBS 119925]|uniref:Carbohydrate-binding module family 50 protein n=1 Tax=Sporormia fimetaria CBS 119925 TaxID=1340428 RepID=A0A6A6VFS9_9PLEO|nr:carbohydrate-binding module family 50 protein [Sporormia fimetaria CBS 119925]
MNRSNASPHPQTNASSSGLRPRPRRLISIEDEYNPPTRGSESDGSALSSRAASPIPRSHPSRPNFVTNASAQAPKALRDTSAALSGLWGNSWTALQGLASNVLSNETDDAAPNGTRRRKPLWDTHRRTSSNALPKQWGPSVSSTSHIGTGLQEDRESMVRAMKRRDLLTAGDQFPTFKRRNSDDRTSNSAPPGEHEDRDALVYVHHVRPQDTLAGVSIKFSCDPAVLRKANRMWPNDSIQTKDVVVLPVDACGVKGRPVPAPEPPPTQSNVDLLEEDLLGGDGEYASTNSHDKAPSTNTSLSLVPSHSSNDTEPPWKHDSWVLLPNDTTPTQIGRMPRRTLGFFPPARRKSLAYSDATPRPSVDMPRSSTSTDHRPSFSQTTSPNPSTRRLARTNSSSHPRPGQRNRSGSNTFLPFGPGGVGTMAPNVKSPGPAQDPLNKLFAAHLPNVAPPPDQEYFTPWAPSLLDAGSGTSMQLAGSGARTPGSQAGLDFQEIGGAIEGWVRKVGSQASKMLSPEPGTPGRRKGGSGSEGLGVIGVSADGGDLIELRDADADFEFGDRRVGGSAGAVGAGAAESENSSSTGGIERNWQGTAAGSATQEFKLSLRERGRRREGGGGGGRKTD